MNANKIIAGSQLGPGTDPQQYKNLDSLGKVDVILVSHGHGDHTGDVSELAKRTGATVLGPAGLIATMIDLGWVAPHKAVRFGKGPREPGPR